MTTDRTIATLVLLLAIGPLTGCSRDTSDTSTTPDNASQTSAVVGGASTPSTPAATEEEGETLGTGDAIELVADYERQCADEETPSRPCEILRGLLVVEVAMALEDIERSRDQRGTQDAFAALDLADEPDIVVAASRILGRFPDTPGIAAKVMPFMLESPYLEVQRVAAELLKAGPDPALADVGGLWLQNHSGVSGDSNYDEYPDFPAHYDSLGFPAYPGAEWFSPADTDRSIGWSTKESVATVTRWFVDSLQEPGGRRRAVDSRAERRVNAARSIKDGAHAATR